MGAQSEFTVKFKTDGSQELSDTFRRSSDAADLFHQKVRTVGSAMDDLRLKSEARVAHNIGNIAQTMVSGANAGDILAKSITGVTESFRGSLLFAGAATAGAALYQGITKTSEAAIQLREDLATLHAAGLAKGDFIGADQVNKNLDAAATKLDELDKRFAQEKQGIAGTVLRALRGTFSGDPFQTFGAARAQDLGQINDLRKSGIAFLDQEATKQETLNEALKKRLTISETQYELDRAQATHNERLGVIAAREARFGITGVSRDQAAENERARLERAFLITPERLFFGAQREEVTQAGLGPNRLAQLSEQLRYVKELRSEEFQTDDQRAQRAVAEAKTLSYIREEQFLESSQLRTAQATTTALEQRSRGEELAAKQTEIRAQYEERISDALHRGRTDIAEQLGRQQYLTQGNAGFSAYEDFRRDPGSYRQRLQNEAFERDRFERDRQDYLNNPNREHSDALDAIFGANNDRQDTQDNMSGSLDKIATDIESILTEIQGLGNKIGVE